MRVPLSAIISELESGVSVNSEDRPALPSEVGVLKVSSVTGGDFRSDENKVVTSAREVTRLSTWPRAGDILMTRANGSRDLVGCSVFVTETHERLFLSDKLWRVVLKDSFRDSPLWLFHVLNTNAIRQRVIEAASGSSGMRNISKEAFLNIPVNRPSLDEQIVVAQTLSIWERGIRQLSDLIAAKVRFKQGLMQQLLTGKRRFKKVGDWQTVQLKDVTEECNERGRNRFGNVSVMAVTKAFGIIPMRERTISGDITRYSVVKQNWFAYNPMRLNIGSIARWSGADDIVVSPDYVVFRCKESPDGVSGLDPDFLDQYRRSNLWERYVTSSGNGSVRIRIYFSDLGHMKLRLPSLPEQKKIAAILATADREIELLRKQLSALKQQKKGLMQKLLTGQVRVTISDPPDEPGAKPCRKN